MKFFKWVIFIVDLKYELRMTECFQFNPWAPIRQILALTRGLIRSLSNSIRLWNTSSLTKITKKMAILNFKNYKNFKSVVEIFFSNYIFLQILSFQASFSQNLNFFSIFLLVWIQRSRLKSLNSKILIFEKFCFLFLDSGPGQSLLISFFSVCL